MNTKTIEIRDRGTFIPAIAIQLDPTNEQDRYLFARSGFGTQPKSQATFVILVHIASGKSSADVYDWDNRTMQTAHDYVIKHFDELTSGQVVDVEFILGVRPEPKISESFDYTMDTLNGPVPPLGDQ